MRHNKLKKAVSLLVAMTVFATNPRCMFAAPSDSEDKLATVRDLDENSADQQKNPHEHDASCYDALGDLVCSFKGDPNIKDHVHSLECYVNDNGQDTGPICSYITRDVSHYAGMLAFSDGDVEASLYYGSDEPIGGGGR